MAIALAVVLLWGSVSSAYARPPDGKAPTVQVRPPVVVIAVSHQRAAKLPPVAHAAGHKIA